MVWFQEDTMDSDIPTGLITTTRDSNVKESCSDDERGGKVEKSANPFADTDIHEHGCRNCGKRFYCALPLCNGSWLDPELCENCEEVLKGIWFPL
jgi:hypothetical protein